MRLHHQAPGPRAPGGRRSSGRRSPPTHPNLGLIRRADVPPPSKRLTRGPRVPGHELCVRVGRMGGRPLQLVSTMFKRPAHSARAADQASRSEAQLRQHFPVHAFIGPLSRCSISAASPTVSSFTAAAATMNMVRNPDTSIALSTIASARRPRHQKETSLGEVIELLPALLLAACCLLLACWRGRARTSNLLIQSQAFCH
jgi:hypothetical protein